MSLSLLLAEGCLLLSESAGEADGLLESSKLPKRYKAYLSHGMRHESPTELDKQHIKRAIKYSKQARASSAAQRNAKDDSPAFKSLSNHRALEHHKKAHAVAHQAQQHFEKHNKPHLARAMHHLKVHHEKQQSAHRKHVNPTHVYMAMPYKKMFSFFKSHPVK